MITITNLNKTYKTTAVLKDLNMNLEKGDIYGFLGNNGAGKSTTLNIINGLIKHQSGSVEIGGSIGYLPEHPVFYDYMTPYEYLRFIGKLQGAYKKKRVMTLLDLVDLKTKKKINTFSRGMKQRLGLAAAIYHEPDILILDEPSSALDPEGRKKMLEIILDLNKSGKTILLSSHILDDIEKICTKIGVLKNGHLIFESKKENLPLVSDETYVVASPTAQTEDFTALESVYKVVKTDQTFEVSTNNKDFFHELASIDHVITKFHMKKHTLEDLFVRMVNNDY